MVKMAPKLTFGPSISYWQERINVERMNRERAEKARETLRKHNIPALLAARPENTRYLTGLRGPEFVPQLWYVLFFAEHDPVVFHQSGWIHMYPSQTPWIKNWRLARSWLNRGCGLDATVDETRLFAAGIHRELEDRGLQNEPLGVVGFDGPAQQALTAKGIKTVDGWPLMLEATRTKTADEINCLKMAFSAAAWNRAWELLKPGAIDVEVSRRSLMAAYDSGADEVPPGYFRSGPSSEDR